MGPHGLGGAGRASSKRCLLLPRGEGLTDGPRPTCCSDAAGWGPALKDLLAGVELGAEDISEEASSAAGPLPGRLQGAGGAELALLSSWEARETRGRLLLAWAAPARRGAQNLLRRFQVFHHLQVSGSPTGV